MFTVMALAKTTTGPICTSPLQDRTSKAGRDARKDPDRPPRRLRGAASWQEMRVEILATLATLMSETQQAMATLNSRPLVNPELVEESGDDESP